MPSSWPINSIKLKINNVYKFSTQWSGHYYWFIFIREGILTWCEQCKIKMYQKLLFIMHSNAIEILDDLQISSHTEIVWTYGMTIDGLLFSTTWPCSIYFRTPALLAYYKLNGVCLTWNQTHDLRRKQVFMWWEYFLISSIKF